VGEGDGGKRQFNYGTVKPQSITETAQGKGEVGGFFCCLGQTSTAPKRGGRKNAKPWVKDKKEGQAAGGSVGHWGERTNKDNLDHLS